MRTGSLNLIFAGIMNIKSRGRASAKLLAKGRFYFKIELSKAKRTSFSSSPSLP